MSCEEDVISAKAEAGKGAHRRKQLTQAFTDEFHMKAALKNRKGATNGIAGMPPS